MRRIAFWIAAAFVFAMVYRSLGGASRSSTQWPPRTTLASFMSDELQGLTMADGEPFDKAKFTCASWDYPLHTVLTLQHGDNTCLVEVTDRGPGLKAQRMGIWLDLSEAAFDKLASANEKKTGHVSVSIVGVETPENKRKTQ